MARVNIPVFRIDRTAFLSNATEVVADAVNDHQVVNDGETFLEVRNTNAAARTFDVHVVGNVDDIPLAEVRTYTVPGLTTGRTGVFPREMYGQTLLVDVATADLRFTAYTVLRGI